MIHVTGEATGFIPARNEKLSPITVIGTEAIREGFDGTCLAQALNSREAPGVTEFTDRHSGGPGVLLAPVRQCQGLCHHRSP